MYTFDERETGGSAKSNIWNTPWRQSQSQGVLTTGETILYLSTPGFFHRFLWYWTKSRGIRVFSCPSWCMVYNHGHSIWPSKWYGLWAKQKYSETFSSLLPICLEEKLSAFWKVIYKLLPGTFIDRDSEDFVPSLGIPSGKHYTSTIKKRRETELDLIPHAQKHCLYVKLEVFRNTTSRWLSFRAFYNDFSGLDCNSFPHLCNCPPSTWWCAKVWHRIQKWLGQLLFFII